MFQHQAIIRTNDSLKTNFGEISIKYKTVHGRKWKVVNEMATILCMCQCVQYAKGPWQKVTTLGSMSYDLLCILLAILSCHSLTHGLWLYRQARGLLQLSYISRNIGNNTNFSCIEILQYRDLCKTIGKRNNVWTNRISWDLCWCWVWGWYPILQHSPESARKESRSKASDTLAR